MRRLILVVFCLLVYAAPSLAQTNPVLAGQPFTVAWDANPASDTVTAYQCYVDSIRVGQDIPVASPRSCVIPAQTAGQHVIEVSAVNVFGEGAKSSLTATAGSPPGAPGGLRITTVTTATIEVTPDGKVAVLASQIEARTVQP